MSRPVAVPYRSHRWLPWTLAVLAYIGFVLAAYLTFVHYRGYVSPCHIVSGCETVQTSSYSVILGVPVALVGAVFFGLLFYLTVGLLRGRPPWLTSMFKIMAFLGALAMLPLFLLQAVVLRAFCTYCLATEILMLAIWILSFLLTTRARSGERVQSDAPTK
ncbi:MAG: vitamin K epoxide reductase family protein [Acidobacteriota bacterium]|nr:vitamin K epoxide reductase family protein [Acidobacteriota bacterium]